MDRQIKAANRLCFDWQVKNNWRALVRSIDSMKPVVEASAEVRVINPAKKRVAEEKRQLSIMHENERFQARLKELKHKGFASLHPKFSEYQKQMKQYQLVRRRICAEEIEEETERHRQRVQGQSPVYRSKGWAQQRRREERYINNISTFKYKDCKPSKTQCNFWSTDSSSTLGKAPGGSRVLPPRSKQWVQLAHLTKRVGSQSYFLELFSDCEGNIGVSATNVAESLNSWSVMSIEEFEQTALSHGLTEPTQFLELLELGKKDLAIRLSNRR